MRTVRTVAGGPGRPSARRAPRAAASALSPRWAPCTRGHEALISSARRTADLVVVSCFVNPAQFDDPRDLAAYPRSEEADAALAAAAGADVFFAPPAGEVYPPGFAAQVRLSGPLVETLEAAHRGAEHFHGVTTVVTKLLNMVGPDVAFFGQKDAQQVAVISRLVRDLDLPVRIEVVPTVREADGLALSSRNVHLAGADRDRAVALHRGLRAAERPCRRRARRRRVAAAAREAMRPSASSRSTWRSSTRTRSRPSPRSTARSLVAVAARVGGTRLIDNTFVGTTPQRPRSHTVPHPAQDPTTPEPMGAAR
jgi:pantoate--beta-alanine ligase